MTKRKIGFYSDPSSLGGSEVYLMHLLKNINRAKYEIFFICPHNHPLLDMNFPDDIKQIHLTAKPFSKDDKNDNDQVVDSSVSNPKLNGKSLKHVLLGVIPNSIKYLLGGLKSILRLRKLFNQYPLDVIHFNDTGCEPPIIAARLSKIKMVTGTLHVLPSYEHGDMSWVHRIIEFVSLRSMNTVIAVSAAAKAAWVKRSKVSGKKVQVIYNGIDLKRFQCDMDIKSKKASLDVRDDEILVGVPARLHPMKGHEFLFQALVEVIPCVPKIKILLIGSGPLQDELVKRAKALGIDRNVNFLGHRDDIHEILQIIDFAVLSSTMLETFGLAAVESMACGKPVIATQFGGFPEVIDDGSTGLLVPIKDSEQMANAIIKLAKEPERCEKMGILGKNRAESLFSIEKMLSNTFAHIDSLAARRG